MPILLDFFEYFTIHPEGYKILSSCLINKILKTLRSVLWKIFNPKEIAEEIAKRVTALRLQRAWTREVLAEQSGVNVYTLKHFERTGQNILASF